MNRRYLFLFSLLLMSATVLQAQPLTVYPGDCNNNGICNNVDLLYIGLGYAATGPMRSVQGIGWSPTGITGVTPWSQSTASGVNYGYMDCDGNGKIGDQPDQDVEAIVQNYGLFHGTIQPDPYAVGTQGDPVLGLQITADTVMGGSTTLIQISLGSAFLPVDSLYGLAFSLSYDTTLVDSIYGDFRTGWLASGTGGVLTLDKDHRDSGRIDFGVTRTDGMNADGAGVIGSIGIVMDDNLKTGMALEELELNFERMLGLTRSEQTIPFHAIRDTLYVLSDREVALPSSQVRVYPNPVTPGLEMLYLDAGRLRIQQVRLLNAWGQIVQTVSVNGQSQFTLDTQHLPPGQYWLQLRTGKGTPAKRILIIPNKN